MVARVCFKQTVNKGLILFSFLDFCLKVIKIIIVIYVFGGKYYDIKTVS